MVWKNHATRRRLLKAAGTGLATGLAGCTGQGDQKTTPAGGTPAEGTTTPSPAGGTTTPSEFIQPGDTGGEVLMLTDYTGGPWQKIWEQEIIPGVKEEHGVDFKAEYVGMAGQGVNRLTTLLQAGKPPESFTGGTGTAGNDSLAGQGDLAKVDHIVDRLTDKVGDLIGKPLLYGGHRLIVPHGLYTGPMTYRRDINEQLGLEVPTTLSKRLHNAKVIDESEKVDARGDSIAAAKSGKSISDFQDILQAHGAWLWQWKTKEKKEAEIWFPKEEVVATLKYMKELAQYGPDPSSISWGSWLQFWTAGRIAQGTFLNAWPAGLAAQAGNVEIARGTAVDIVPVKEGVEPYAPQYPGFDGHPAIKPADNVPGLFTVLLYMYDNPERAAPYYTIGDPARFLPAYSDIMESDAFKNGGIYKKYPSILKQMMKCRDKIAPRVVDPQKIADTAATLYAGGFSIGNEMINQVVVTGRDPEKAWAEARDRYKKRLKEGKEKYGHPYSG